MAGFESSLFTSFPKRNPLFNLLNSARFHQIVLDNSRWKKKLRSEMSVPTVFDAYHCFHGIALMTREIGIKRLNIIGKAVISTMTVVAIQSVEKALDALK